MTMRDTAIRALHEAGGADLRSVVAGMVEALIECDAEGVEDASHDPAVMLFGAHVAFLTHFDINTMQGYTSLLNSCATREKYPETLQ